MMASRELAAGIDSRALSGTLLAAHPELGSRLAGVARKYVPAIEGYLSSRGFSESEAIKNATRGVVESHLSRFDDVARQVSGQVGLPQFRRVGQLRAMLEPDYTRRARETIAPLSQALEAAFPLDAQLAAEKGPLARSRPGGITVAEIAMPAPLPTPRQSPRQVPATVTAPGPVQPRILSQEVGEVVARELARAERQEAVDLLLAIGLTDELEHFEALEERLLRGTNPSRIHAAMSADVLLKGLSNRLFPPQDGVWISRFDNRHRLGASHVRNRLAAFIDVHLRAKLKTHEHRQLESTLACVFRWAGEGHHVAFEPREAAEAFYHLLKILSAVARAHRTSLS